MSLPVTPRGVICVEVEEGGPTQAEMLETLREIQERLRKSDLVQAELKENVVELKENVVKLKKDAQITKAKVVKLEQDAVLTRQHLVLTRRSITTFGILVYLVETIDPSERKFRRPIIHSKTNHYWKVRLVDIIKQGLGNYFEFRESNRAFRSNVTMRTVDKLVDSVVTQDRHEHAHPERDQAQLLSDGLAIEAHDRLHANSGAITAVLTPFIATLGSTRFKDLVETINQDDGERYEPVDEAQVVRWKRIFM